MYNKINVVRHLEERECPNCGKVWTIWCRKLYSKSHRFAKFCPECIQTLSPWERKKIRISKFPESREKYQAMKRGEFERRYIAHILHRAEIRAKKHNLEFNITAGDVVIPKVCPILEVPLVIGTKGNYEYSPSIDRIDNTKGYIKGNIQIISKKANSMKNSATKEELKMFCKNILRYSLTTA